MAERIQRKRTKGWRMPPGTVCVDRPTVFGNPWSIAEVARLNQCGMSDARIIAVDIYRRWLLEGGCPSLEHQRRRVLARLPSLQGRNLACPCPEGQPCHADVLLELANR